MKKKGDLSHDFNRHEFACQCGCGFDTADALLVRILQDVRDHFGRPVHINSACRCPSHNQEVGGADDSQHLYGRAADIKVGGLHPNVVADYVEHRWPDCGIGRYFTFTHVDTRTNGPARWDMREKKE